MNSSTGTIIRGFFVMSILIIFWYSLASCIYYFITLFFGLEFELKTNIIICLILTLIRMFYPKNVFI